MPRISEVPRRVLCVPVVVFGEVLFDGFPDGRRVLGGAPFNVAWGLRTEGLRTEPEHVTGEVAIELKGGEPSYEICMPRAWDYIGDDGFAATRVLYHGLLALRSETSRRTLEGIRERSAGAVRFFDINLRPPHDSRARLREWMRGADWLKLNLEELAAVRGLDRVVFAESDRHVDRLQDEYGIRNVLLTAGAEGLLLRGETGEAVCSPAPPVAQMEDTVGAGDSISAVVIDGLLRGMPAQAMVEAAGRFASKICGIRGATTERKEFYSYE